jgi:CheY-like chemotaxis protein
MPRLLLVDDNPSIHRIVVSLLGSTDIEISYAQSSAEALELIANDAPFGLALLDTSLPEMDGWGLLGRLRNDPKTSSMPIAMMAGVLEEVDGNLVDSPQIQAFLRKPIDLRDLPERVQALFEVKVAARRSAPAIQMPCPPDLILLGEMDLAEGETEIALPARQIAVASGGEPAPALDEKITLELEALDFRDFEHLVQLEDSKADQEKKSALAPLDANAPIYGQHADLLDMSGSSKSAMAISEDESADFGFGSMALSSIASELLSNTKFIDVLAKAVEERMRRKDL